MFFSQEESLINAELEPLYGNYWSESSRHFLDSQMLQYLQKKCNCSLFLFFLGFFFLGGYLLFAWVVCFVFWLVVVAFCCFVCLFFIPWLWCLFFSLAITNSLPKLFTTLILSSSLDFTCACPFSLKRFFFLLVVHSAFSQYYGEEMQNI